MCSYAAPKYEPATTIQPVRTAVWNSRRILPGECGVDIRPAMLAPGKTAAWPVPLWPGSTDRNNSGRQGHLVQSRRGAHGERRGARRGDGDGGALPAAAGVVCQGDESRQRPLDDIVKINDRGPWARGFLIDLSLTAGRRRARCQAYGGRPGHRRAGSRRCDVGRRRSNPCHISSRRHSALTTLIRTARGLPRGLCGGPRIPPPCTLQGGEGWRPPAPLAKVRQMQPIYRTRVKDKRGAFEGTSGDANTVWNIRNLIETGFALAFRERPVWLRAPRRKVLTCIGARAMRVCEEYAKARQQHAALSWPLRARRGRVSGPVPHAVQWPARDG